MRTWRSTALTDSKQAVMARRPGKNAAKDSADSLMPLKMGWRTEANRRRVTSAVASAAGPEPQPLQWNACASLVSGGVSLAIMTVLSQEVPHGVVEWLGDFRWWTRLPYYSDGRSTVAGVPVGDVAATLRRVYDEATCAAMVAAGRWTPMLGLFAGGFEWTGKMLGLGVDLVTCPEALDDGELLAGLRGSQWTGARAEIGVWAGLRRAGLNPRRPDLRSDEKQYDFLLRLDGLDVAIECKAGPGSDTPTPLCAGVNASFRCASSAAATSAVRREDAASFAAVEASNAAASSTRSSGVVSSSRSAARPELSAEHARPQARGGRGRRANRRDRGDERSAPSRWWRRRHGRRRGRPR